MSSQREHQNMSDRNHSHLAPSSGPSTPPEPPARDDTIILRALVASLVILLTLGAAVAATVYYLNRDPGTTVVEEKPLVLPRVQRKTVAPPEVRFTDVTEAAGIGFFHENGARGEKLLPETMGPGCAFLDFDSDGDPDLFLVNGKRWPGDDDTGSDEAESTPALYQNDGRGRFRDVTEGSGLDVGLYGMGVAVGDFDGDADPDVFITCVGPNRLFRNDGGKFVDVTAAAGVAGSPSSWSSSSGFFDADNDGDLDLFVCNYVKWSREIDFAVDYRLVGVGRAYGPPNNFEGVQPYFYRNSGDGTFREEAEACGLHVTNPATRVPVAKSLAVVPFDADEDGWVDLFVANDTVRNFFFRNLGKCRFEEKGVEAGVAYDGEGRSTGAMGTDVAYYRNDSALGVAVGNFATEMSSLYVMQRRETLFNDESITEGIGPRSRQQLSFGLFFFDYDLDGRLDLFQTNGHLEEEINKVQSSQHYRQPSQLFWNCGPDHATCFTPVPADSTGDLARPVVGRAAAYADIDGDGDLDILVTQNRDRPLLLRNDQATGHHWLRLRLAGTRSNREGIGAIVEVTAGGQVQRRLFMPTRSYLAQVEPVLTFGLGRETTAEIVRVRWPGSARPQEVRGLEADRLHVITEEPLGE